jgi:sugar lactone lactonase YvrE
MQDGARLRRLVLAALLLMLLAAAPAAAAESAFERRDVLVGLDGGEILVYGSDGSLKRTLRTQAQEICGMAFDEEGRLHATTFRSNSVVRFDAAGNPLGTFGSGYDANPESILFDRDGNVYVGQAEGGTNVVKFGRDGRELARYPVQREERGSDWIDLHPDQRTLYYTSEGTTVFRYDLRSAKQLDPLTESLTDAFALRILPNGDVLVADTTRIVRIDNDGELTSTYDATDEDDWFALTLDPDGHSFWSANYVTGDVVRFEIDTGKVLTRINTDKKVRGLLVVGERTAALTSELPGFSLALRSPRDVSWSARQLAVNLFLAAAAILLIAFPAQLFNATFEQHVDEIRGGLRRIRPRLGHLPSFRRRRTWVAYAGLTLAVAFVYAFLDPDFPTGGGSVELYLGVILGLLLTTLVFAGAEVAYMQVRHRDRGRLRLFPEALAIAVVCVAISRLAGFQPGYLYGVVVGVVFALELAREEEGRRAALTAAWLLVLGLTAWLVQTPVHDRALDAGSALPIRVLDVALVTTFTAAIETVAFGLVPLRFLAGAKLFEWSRVAWAALIGTGIFLLVQVLLNPQAGYLSTSPFWVSALLFLAFGLASVLFWGYFRFRPMHRPPEVPSARSV